MKPGIPQLIMCLSWQTSVPPRTEFLSHVVRLPQRDILEA